MKYERISSRTVLEDRFQLTRQPSSTPLPKATAQSPEPKA